MKPDKLFKAIKGSHDGHIAELQRRYLGLEVTLIDTCPVKSRGRAAIIDDIIVQDGVPLFLCMVLRSGSETEFLNSDGWTRQYRKWNEFIILEEYE